MLAWVCKYTLFGTSFLSQWLPTIAPSGLRRTGVLWLNNKSMMLQGAHVEGRMRRMRMLSHSSDQI